MIYSVDVKRVCTRRYTEADSPVNDGSVESKSLDVGKRRCGRTGACNWYSVAPVDDLRWRRLGLKVERGDDTNAKLVSRYSRQHLVKYFFYVPPGVFSVQVRPSQYKRTFLLRL